MKFSVRDYSQLLQSLLPKGRVWSRDPNAVITQVLNAEAEELSKIDNRMDDLLTERDTRQADELLGEHELDLGLPDECSPDLGTIAQRRIEAHVKFISLGGQHKQYYIDLAEALGFTSLIVEYIYNRFHWSLVTQSVPGLIFYFTSGVGESGDYLASISSSSILECVMNKLKPAHTVIDFKYSDYGFGAGFGPGFDSVFKRTDSYFQGGFGRGFGISFDVYYGGGFNYRQFGRGFNTPAIPGYDSLYGPRFGAGFGAGFQKGKLQGW